MATQAAQGAFDLTTASGNQSVTGVGFEPDVILLWHATPVTGAHTELLCSLGVGISSSERFCISGRSRNSVSTASCSRRHDDERILEQFQIANSSLRWDVDLVSLDSNGFTLDKVTPPPSVNQRVGYLALDGMSNVAAVVWQGSGSSQSVSAGFAPHCAITFTINSSTVPPVTDNDCLLGMGVVDSNDNQWSWAVSSRNGVTTTECSQVFDGASGLITMDNTGAIDGEATCTLTGSGMDVTWSNTSTSYFLTLFLRSANGAGDFVAGTGTFPTTNSTTVLSPGHDPLGVLLSGCALTTPGTPVANNMFSYGWSDGANESQITLLDEDAQTTVDTDRLTQEVRTLNYWGANKAAKGNCQASFDVPNQEIDLAWTGTDGSEYNFGFLSIGDGEADATGAGFLPLMHVGA